MTIMYLLAYITIGLVIGWISRLITQERGVTLLPSLAFGVLGALAGTGIVYTVDLAGTAFYAAVGAVSVLFTVNVFRQDEPIFSEAETS